MKTIKDNKIICAHNVIYTMTGIDFALEKYIAPMVLRKYPLVVLKNSL